MSSFDSSSLFNVEGLVAVITGGGSGIGLVMAKALALNGAARVYIVGRRKEVLEAATKESPHGNIIPIVGDVTSKESLQAITQKISHDVGYVNVLVANSGILGPQATKGFQQMTNINDFQQALWGLDFNEYTETFAVNTSAAYFTAVAFLGLLNKGNQKKNVGTRSQIIITSSIAGFNRQTPGGFAYGQSKAAATHLTKQLATTLAPHGIRTNALAPGLFQSDLAAPIINLGGFTKDRIPEERIGKTEEMAGAILYLTSQAGGYCNGNILLIDGGRLSMAPNSY